MAIVKIYYGRGYDIGADVVMNTKRPARRETILRLNLQLLAEPVYEVDENALDSEGFLKKELLAALREDSLPG